MPKYEYACKDCGEHLEVVQSFKDDPLRECPSCRGTLRKVFGNIGIVFKGSGFYRTDNRSSAGSRDKAEKADKVEKAEKAEKAGSGTSSGDTKAGAASGEGSKSTAGAGKPASGSDKGSTATTAKDGSGAPAVKSA